MRGGGEDAVWDEVVWTGPEAQPAPGGPARPLLSLEIAARRGLSLCVEGGVERLWLRTHFRALRLLLLCATHDNLCPFAAGFPC